LPISTGTSKKKHKLEQVVEGDRFFIAKVRSTEHQLSSLDAPDTFHFMASRFS
jgi:hypothetical protein